jgi:hypothetical protein
MAAERVANIGSAGRRRRLIGGVFWLALGVAATGLITRAHARSWWYALLALPFTMAALGYFQARART